MKTIKINDFSCSYLCNTCDGDEHIDIHIKVIVDDVELFNLINSNNPGKDEFNNFLLEESKIGDVNLNMAYHFIYTKITGYTEKYSPDIEYLTKLFSFCEAKNIKIELS